MVIDNLSKGHRDAVIDQAFSSYAVLLDRMTVKNVLQEFGTDAVVHP